MSTSNRKDRPNKLPLPPMLLAACLFAAWGLDTFLPIGWEQDQVGTFMRATGVLLIVVALAIDVWAFQTLRRNKTTILPNKAASQLAVDGPFAHSRNPIYLGNVALCLGVGFLIGSRWFVLMAAVLFVLLSELAIKREEAHLAANFSEEWESYKSKVRRWI